MPDLSTAPEWYRPVLRAAALADRGARAARRLWTAGWVVLGVALVGDFLRAFSPRAGDEIFTTDLEFTREAAGLFAARLGIHGAYAAVLLGMSMWVRAVSSQLQVDAARAHETALPDLAG